MIGPKIGLSRNGFGLIRLNPIVSSRGGNRAKGPRLAPSPLSENAAIVPKSGSAWRGSPEPKARRTMIHDYWQALIAGVEDVIRKTCIFQGQPGKIGENCAFSRLLSVLALADDEWRAAAAGLKPFRFSCAPNGAQ